MGFVKAGPDGELILCEPLFSPELPNSLADFFFRRLQRL
jgi:hypothetical protein